MLKKGDIYYAKRLSKKPTRSVSPVTFGGFGCVMYLQTVSQNTAPTKESLKRSLAEIGFIGCDDLNEFLGMDVMKDIMHKFTSKYGGVSPITGVNMPTETLYPEIASPPLGLKVVNKETNDGI